MHSSEPVAGLQHLDRPEGAADTVYTQFGNAILDMRGLGARHCRYRIGLEQISACLERHFSADSNAARASAWRERLKTETRAQQERLSQFGHWLNSAMERWNQDPDIDDHDGESFIAYQEEKPLTPFQDNRVRTMGTTLARQWEEWRQGVVGVLDQGDRFIPNLNSDLDKRRQVLMRLVRKRHMILTEVGWHWIDNEDDGRCLDLLCMVCAADPACGQLDKNILRGLLEHRALCKQLLTYVTHPPAALANDRRSSCSLKS